MQNHAFNTLQVADGTRMELYVAFPEGTGTHPAIIVLQEGFGLTQHIRNVAERLCKEGYAVVSPELFHRTGHRVEAAYDDFPSVMHHYQAITNEGLTADLEAA
jgi:carboxymethylenebutenolidase